MIIGSWQDEAWAFYDKVNAAIVDETTGALMSEVERKKALWESLDWIVGALPEHVRQEFRETLFTLSSNSIGTSAEETRDLVRRWLSINDPGKSYRH